MKVHEIKSEFYNLAELIASEEFRADTGELIDNSKEIEELLNSLEDEKSVKADNIAFLLNANKDSQNNLKSEIDRLNARKKVLVNEESRIKNLLTYLLNGVKLKTELHTFSYRKSTSVNITDEAQIDDCYMKIETVRKPIKADIKKAILDGSDEELLRGAEIVTNISLSVK